MSAPLRLDDVRCLGCGRAARVVECSTDVDFTPPKDGETIAHHWEATDEFPEEWALDCGPDCGFECPRGPEKRTLRFLLTDDEITIGPGLGRLLVEALEALSPATAWVPVLCAHTATELLVINGAAVASVTEEEGDPGLFVCKAGSCLGHPVFTADSMADGRRFVEAARARESWGNDDVPAAAVRDPQSEARPQAPIEYTSAPPPPSPDGVTWWRYNSLDFPKAWMAVEGQEFRIHDINGRRRGPRYTVAAWLETERRSTVSVDPPDWAEGGEG